MTLDEVELDAVGEVRGKRLLHLQCASGKETLSWAVLGAEVVGVDCRAETRLLAGSLFERSKLPLETWFAAAWCLTNQKGGVSALGLQRALGQAAAAVELLAHQRHGNA